MLSHQPLACRRPSHEYHPHDHPAQVTKSSGIRLSLPVLRDLFRLIGPLFIVLAGTVLFSLLEMGYADQPIVDHRQYLAISLLGGLIQALLGRAQASSGRAHSWSAGSAWAEVRSWLLTSVILLALYALAEPLVHVSLLWAVLWFASGLVMLPFLVLGTDRLLEKLAKLGVLRTPSIAVVGATEQAYRLLRSLPDRGNDSSCRFLGVFDDRLSQERISKDLLGVIPWCGTTADLLSLHRQEPIDAVVIALPHHAAVRVGQLAQKLACLPVDLMLCPDLVGLPQREVWGASRGKPEMLELYRQPHRGWAAIVKWTQDKLIAGLALLALGPLMLIIAALIRIDSKGPVFFRQPRYGFDNKPFYVLKFRTMYHHLSDLGGTRHTVKGDQRVTRIGRILRRCSLDELPQLINVLRGEMSIVGPRPHPLQMKVLDQNYDEVVATYAARHRVRPGITGLAQVSGLRGEVDTLEKAHRRVEHDLQYIENWSLLLDLKILLLTLTRGLLSPEAH